MVIDMLNKARVGDRLPECEYEDLKKKTLKYYSNRSRVSYV